MTSDFVDVDPTTPLDGRRWEGDVQKRDNDASDDVGHGTHVAGIIAARNVGQAVGVAPAATLMCGRVFGRLVNQTSGRAIGFGTAFDIAAGVDWTTKQGAQIINMSLGLDGGSPSEKQALRRAVVARCIPVAAMGNGGALGPHQFPAAYPDTLAVGAVDDQKKRCSWSQTGSHIDLMAPGVNVVSTALGGGFVGDTGTSMACAFVSGVAALVRSARPDLGVAAVRQILQETASPGVSSPDDQTGWGTVDAFAAVRAAQNFP